jgi:alpha-beta hydrolase superfamily lysophospholipase/SAM-dependent methyltransferase
MTAAAALKSPLRPVAAPVADGSLTARPPTEHHFDTHDGQSLFYRHWPATQGVRKGAVLLFHRGHEHGGRMAHLVDELQLPEFDVFAWDARGHGRSPGARGFSPSFGTSVRDIQTFVDHLCRAHALRVQDLHVVAQSVGAVLAATWVHDYAPPIRGLTLASPAFKVKLYVPFARSGIRLWQALRGPFFVNSYVKPTLLTHDAERVASYQRDPLVARPIASHILLGLYEAAERVVADAAAITVPVQMMVSGADWVVHRAPQRRFFDRLGSPVKEWHDLPGFFHDTLGERDRAAPVARIRDFIREGFGQAPQLPDLRQAHRQGPTFDEAQRLAAPLPALSLRRAWWAAYRANLKLASPLSAGIRLGHETGFDSGSTLDYVYRNQAQGAGPLGRLVDRHYLDAIGWRGIRVRKGHVEELLGLAMAQLAAQGLDVRVVDIAAGHGRYVLDAVAQAPQRPQAVLLRDYSPINVRDGRALITRRGLGDLARFEQADAFDRASLAAMRLGPQDAPPTLAVVSGLYELFADNELVARSLAGLADALPAGARLVYTGQPWHPQLEMIARALTSHRQGQAWVMRRRTQQELDQLVAAAGFCKLTQRVDEWGIFTVSLAERVRA